MPAPNGKIRVFVVEDHVRAAEALKGFLEVSGFTVHVAHDVKSALKQAGEIEFDVLLCDLHLPDGTGWDLLPQLRKNNPKVRGLAFSAFGDHGHLERSRVAVNRGAARLFLLRRAGGRVQARRSGSS